MSGGKFGTVRSMRDPKVQALIGVGGAVVIALAVLFGMWLGGRSNSDVSVTDTTTPATSSSTTSTTTSTTNPPALNTTSTTTIPPIRAFPDIFEVARGAVANVDVIGCDGGSQGTAFMVDEETAYTAWHVVEDAAQIALTFDEERVEAAVIGHNAERDVAVLRLAEPIEGATLLPIAAEQPRVGEEVAAIGHPRGLPLAMTVGRVTSMNGDFDFSGTGDDIVENLIQTDSVVAPGSSGGPLVNQRGEAIGVVILKDIAAEGLMYAADIDGVRTQLLDWTETPQPVEAAFCVGAVDIRDIDEIAGELIASEVDTPEVPELQRTFAVYTQSINSGRADSAFGILGPSITTNNTAEAWAEGQQTSSLWDWRIREIRATPNGLEVRSTFTSTQSPEYGFDGESTCTRWDITHDVVEGEFRGREFWLIDGSRASEGTSPVDCLDWQPTIVRRASVPTPGVGESVEFSDVLSAGTVDEWTMAIDLPADAGPATFVVDLFAQDAMFDPFLQVTNEVGVVISENDDREPGIFDSQLEFVVESSQVVQIRAQDLTHYSGGPYRLVVSQAAG